MIGLAGIAFAGLAGFVLFAASVSRYSSSGGRAISIPGADGVVVLTGGPLRVKEGLRLFEQTQARRILISGVHRHTTRDQLRRQTGLHDALFACCVDIGYGALDTSGNAAETREWAEVWGFSRLHVVTSSYHMPRSLLELGGKLPNVTLVPHPVVPPSYSRAAWWANMDVLRTVAIEYVKSLPSMARLGVDRVAIWLTGQEAIRATQSRPPSRAALMP